MRVKRSLMEAYRDARDARRANVTLVYNCADGFGANWLAQTRAQACGMDVDVRWAEQRSLAYALSEAALGNLFGMTVTLYRRMEGFAGKVKLSDADVRALDDYVLATDVAPVVLEVVAPKVDQRLRAVKTLVQSAHATVVDGGALAPGELRELAQTHLGTLRLRPDQFAQLAKRATSPGLLANEATKLALFADGQEAIADSDFEALLGPDPAAEVFAIVDATVRGDFKRAWNAYSRLGKGESALGLLALLARQYRLIAEVCASPAGTTDAQLAARLGVHPYACKVARELSARVSVSACRTALAELADAEYAIKSGQLSESAALVVYYMRCAERSTAGRSA